MFEEIRQVRYHNRFEYHLVRYTHDELYDSILHRVDGPAIVFDDGRTVWYRFGVKHNTGGPFDSRYPNEWYINGVLLFKEEVLIAKGILNGDLFNKIPLYINDPILQHFCFKMLNPLLF